jgi:hypothetical protein
MVRDRRVALSSGEGDDRPVKHQLDFRGNRRFNSVLYIASVTQHRDLDDARVYIDRKLSDGKTRREANTPSSQTSPRQPSHPPHVERRRRERPVTMAA